MSKTEIKVDDIGLLKNNKQFDRKGGKFLQKWLGPYTVKNISDKGVATLKNASGVTLKNKYNIVQLKHYIQGTEDAVQQSENSFPGHKCETYASIKSTYRKWARIIE